MALRVEKKTTSWFEIECWDKQAEIAGEYLKKGKFAVCTGTMKSREYQGKTYWTLNAQKVEFNSSLIVITGNVTNVEKRYIADNKTVYCFSIGDYKAEYFKKEINFSANQQVTVIGKLEMVDYKPVIQVKQVISNNTDNPEDLIDEEDIPF